MCLLENISSSILCAFHHYLPCVLFTSGVQVLSVWGTEWIVFPWQRLYCWRTQILLSPIILVFSADHGLWTHSKGTKTGIFRLFVCCLFCFVVFGFVLFCFKQAHFQQIFISLERGMSAVQNTPCLQIENVWKLLVLPVQIFPYDLATQEKIKLCLSENTPYSWHNQVRAGLSLLFWIFYLIIVRHILDYFIFKRHCKKAYLQEKNKYVTFYLYCYILLATSDSS